MNPQNYAWLDAPLQNILYFNVLDSDTFSSLAPDKQARWRLVVMTAQPTFDPVTQIVVQNGWTILSTTVNPIWVVQSVTGTQLTWNQMLNMSLVTAYNNYIATAVPSQAATNALVKQLAQAMTAILQHQYGDTT